MHYSRMHDDEAEVLRLSGEFDAVTAPDLRSTLDALAIENAVVVDLSGLRLIDSSGVGALVSLYKRVRSHGGSVRFRGLTGQPLAIFKLLRLDVVFSLDGSH